MSVALDTVKSISWFAVFRLISQSFSWAVTIIIARMLLPEDYALMEMATLFTGYAALFSELGLGAAIVQSKETNQMELSSVFWFGFLFSTLLGLSCVIIAYPTALIFQQERLIHITQAVSIIFILNGLVIVPANILRKEMQFKKLGIIEMFGVLVSSSCMVVIAYSGGGVWTFIGGHIIRDSVKAVLYYTNNSWYPSLHFKVNDVRQYLKFGLAMSFGNSFKYVSEKSDRFFGGLFWSPPLLGQYSFALQLSELPNQKISSIINQVSFAALSKLQGVKDKFSSLYLQLTKMMFSIVTPLYLGGFWIGADLFALFLGHKWDGAIFFFRALCLVQILKTLAPINFQVHAAQGRARLFFLLRASNGIVLPITFYFTIRYGGTYGIIMPWFTTYVVFLCILIGMTLKWMDLSYWQYIRNLIHPIIAAALMSGALLVLQKQILSTGEAGFGLIASLCLKICIGAGIYIGYFSLFDKQLISDVRTLRGGRHQVAE